MTPIEEIKTHLRTQRKWWQCLRHYPHYWVADSGEGEGQTWLKTLDRPISFQNERASVRGDAVFFEQFYEKAHAVIFCVNLSVLKDEARLSLLKEEWKTHLAALQQRRFVRIPLYFIVMGAETVEGFSSYVQKLKPGETNQILGVSFNESVDLKAELSVLHQQLESKVLAQLSWDHSKNDENETILFFPQTLAKVYDQASQFIGDLLKTQPNTKAKFAIRGLYFTALAGQEGKTYFAKAIDTEVIQKEKSFTDQKQGLIQYLEAHQKRLWAFSLLAVMAIVALSWALLFWIEAPTALPSPPAKIVVPTPVIKPVDVKKMPPPKPATPTLNCNSNISINMTPMVLSKNLAKFSVTSGSQGFFYQNGPRFLSILNWTRNAGDVTVQFTGLDGSILNQTYAGGSGLIRFLSSASETSIDATHTALTFSNGPYSATYSVSVIPGTLNEVLALRNLHCNNNF